MMHVFKCTVVGTILICGLNTQAAQPAETPGQDQPTQEKKNTAEPHNTHPAAFEVPAMWEYSAPLIAPESATTILVGPRRTPPWSITTEDGTSS